MQFYLILSLFNSSYVFNFHHPIPSYPVHGGISAHVVRRVGTNTTLILLTGALGVGGAFPPLHTPLSKRFHLYQTTAIIVVVIMLETGGGGRGRFWPRHYHLPHRPLP